MTFSFVFLSNWDCGRDRQGGKPAESPMAVVNRSFLKTVQRAQDRDTFPALRLLYILSLFPKNSIPNIAGFPSRRD